MESWKDLAKLLWMEMNPVEGYTSPQANARVNKINGTRSAAVFKNNINNIRNIDGNYIKLPFMTKANSIGGDTIMPDGKKFMEAYVVPEEYVKYIKRGSDRITNRIPNVTLGKMANKLMSYPAVQTAGKVIESTATPLMVIDMLKLQGSYPYTQNQYKQMLNNMGIQYNNGQIQL